MARIPLDVELVAAIRAGNATACLRLLTGASETDRAIASPSVRAIFDAAQFERYKDNGKDFATLGIAPCGFDAQFRIRQAAQIANLGTTADVPCLKKPFWETVPAKVLVAILRQRRPPFPPQWPKLLWAKLNPIYDWHVARTLVREGLCATPTSDDYVLGMIWTADNLERAYDDHTREGDPPPPELFEDDPALLENDVWRVFEVEGNREVSLTGCQSFWHDGLLELAANGRLGDWCFSSMAARWRCRVAPTYRKYVSARLLAIACPRRKPPAT